MEEDIKSKVSILMDWRLNHIEEHKEIWKQFTKQTEINANFIDRMARQETKIFLFGTLGAMMGGGIVELLARLWK